MTQARFTPSEMATERLKGAGFDQYALRLNGQKQTKQKTSNQTQKSRLELKMNPSLLCVSFSLVAAYLFLSLWQ